MVSFSNTLLDRRRLVVGKARRCGVKASTIGGFASQIGFSVGANEGPAGGRRKEIENVAKASNAK